MWCFCTVAFKTIAVMQYMKVLLQVKRQCVQHKQKQVVLIFVTYNVWVLGWAGSANKKLCWGFPQECNSGASRFVSLWNPVSKTLQELLKCYFHVNARLKLNKKNNTFCISTEIHSSVQKASTHQICSAITNHPVISTF